MSIHHVQGPPQIQTASYSFSADMILGKLRMEAFHLGYAYCLRHLFQKSLVSPSSPDILAKPILTYTLADSR